MFGLKNAIVCIMRICLQAVYALMKLIRRRENTVVFLSRQCDDPSENFMLLSVAIKELEPESNCVYSCRLGLKTQMGVSYIPLLLRQMWLLAAARACVTESYCPPISLLNHHKDMRVVQIWHSMVAIKKFGWQTVDTPEGSSAQTAQLMRMHRGYDYVITGSEFQRAFFAEAMNTPLSKVVAFGTPVADRLLKYDCRQARAELEKKYPQLYGKKLIAYAPTMRRGEAVDCAGLVCGIDYDSFALIVRLHPLDKQTMLPDSPAICDTSISLETLLAAADIIISDYSGAAAEGALLGKQMYFYLPDEQRYSQRCGLNMYLSECFPEISFASAEELCKALQQPYDERQLELVKRLLVGGCDGCSTMNIARLVLYNEFPQQLEENAGYAANKGVHRQ